jgi:predicted type IV restriction endonuclease
MSQPEAFSRILIDKALEFSGWDLLNPKQVQFEFHALNGRADYLLKDNLGRVLCVVEAKREGLPWKVRHPPIAPSNY